MASIPAVKFYDHSLLSNTTGTQPAKLHAYSSHPQTRRTNWQSSRTLKREASETLQQAALINIVAAVNEDLHGDSVTKADVTIPGSARDSLQNTVAVISTLMTPRNRSVSIPNPQQRVIIMSDDTVQKKPVYYRHSEDMDGHDYKASRADNIKVQTKAKANVEFTSPSPVQSVKIIPITSMKTTYNDADFKIYDKELRKANDKLGKTAELNKEVRTTSPIRRLGTLKKHQVRKVHEISKCDAVDLMDTNKPVFDVKQFNSQDPAKAVLDDSRKIIPQSHMLPYYRPESLPGAFPAKTKKFNRAKSSPPGKQHVYKNKNPIARSISKDSSQSMYSRVMSLPGGFGFETLAIGNGVNQDPDVLSPLSHDSNKAPNPRVSFTGIASQRHRLRTPGTPMTYGTESNVSFGSVFYDHQTEILSESTSHRHEAIESVMGRTSKTEEADVNDKENENTYLPAHDKTCHIAMETPKRSARKVQFNNKDISTSSDESFTNELPSGSPVNGGSGIIQMPMSVFRSYSPAIQPMSAHELLRFRQRIIPVSMQHQNPICQQYLSTSSIMTIKQYCNQNTTADPAKGGSANVESDSNERDDESDANLDDYMADEAELDKTEETECSSGTKSGNNIKERDVANVEERKTMTHSSKADDPTNDFYKLIKAVDTHAYSGFEHKKLRRVPDSVPSREIGKRKGHYIRVKLGT